MQTASPRYVGFLSAVFVTTLLISNIIAVKIGSFGGFFLPVAVVIFPLSYILSDIITEVYGFRVMRTTIWTGFACNLLAVIILMLAQWIPSAPFYTGQEAFVSVLGSTPRILAASFVAYLIGEFTNAMILAKLKVKTAGSHLWFRTIVSTLVGEGLDSAIFITLAFGGVFPAGDVMTLVITQWLFKVAVEVAATPLTYAATGFLKKSEGIDVYDTQTRFSPLPTS